ncbi:hypothetical protein GGR57DRAFT_471780 [Xylariaceae sp. FL1272]|nr:hypothetical protein GGR57DRAFT_471780 [Xylariaceae sp. FL1272]
MMRKANSSLDCLVSDDKVNMGTVEVQDIMDILNSACAESGNCDTNEQGADGQIIGSGRGGEVVDITVNVTPGGSYGMYRFISSYVGKESWIHNGLLDTLHAALDAAVECEEVTHSDDCVGSGLGSYCPPNEITVNQCKLPNFIAINYQDKDAADAAPPFIEAKLNLEVDSSGYCETFTTVGSSIAGEFKFLSFEQYRM